MVTTSNYENHKPTVKELVFAIGGLASAIVLGMRIGTVETKVDRLVVVVDTIAPPTVKKDDTTRPATTITTTAQRTR